MPTEEPAKAVDDVITGGHPTGFGNILVIVIALLAVGFVVVLSVVLIVVFYVLGKNKKK